MYGVGNDRRNEMKNRKGEGPVDCSNVAYLGRCFLPFLGDVKMCSRCQTFTFPSIQKTGRNQGYSVQVNRLVYRAPLLTEEVVWGPQRRAEFVHERKCCKRYSLSTISGSTKPIFML